MKIVIVGALPESIINFRGDLIQDLVKAGHKVTAMSMCAPPDIVAQLNRLNVDFIPYPVQRNGLNPFVDIQTFFVLIKIFMKLKPDVVLAYTIKPVIWGGLAIQLASRRTKFVAMIEGLGFVFQPQSKTRMLLKKIVAFLYKIALKKASKIIFLNQENKELFVSQRITSAEKCTIVDGIGVDLDKFSVKRLKESDPVFLCIARLLGDKGLREYANAAREVRRIYPKVRFLLVGQQDPSPNAISLEEIQMWKNEGHIEYLGSTSDVRNVIAQCHIYVLPSYHEGMPRTIMEAMAIGRPILTTTAPGCRNTVEMERNGFLVPAGDVPALIERMIWFLENREMWHDMGLESRRIAEKRFDVHKINAEFIKILQLNTG